MAQQVIEDLDKLQGVTLSGTLSQRRIVLKLLKASLPVLSELALKAASSSAISPLAVEAIAALHLSVTSLVEAAVPKCNLSSPPADIDVRVDGNGNMVYRCRHNSPHEWDLAGKKLK
jgi:hypothetical protein